MWPLAGVEPAQGGVGCTRFSPFATDGRPAAHLFQVDNSALRSLQSQAVPRPLNPGPFSYVLLLLSSLVLKLLGGATEDSRRNFRMP